ncbi:hypothetical protein JX265_011417 [Neoarthrinium moseri]|uniref:Uncharacterized protein n=1 Tax=Neoarthrinium moseri TaxID=1658444 RepID=A0A9P9WC86_9PEZI|nr:hypothetical protein JX266_001842 [Neoarthrinium moseri]KAI1856776.1 hypothetical protein JX265_011417 [Neoarthrinium moseri]
MDGSQRAGQTATTQFQRTMVQQAPSHRNLAVLHITHRQGPLPKRGSGGPWQWLMANEQPLQHWRVAIFTIMR